MISDSDQAKAELIRAILQAAVPECCVETWWIAGYVSFKCVCRINENVYATQYQMLLQLLRDTEQAEYLARKTAERWSVVYAKKKAG